MLRQIRNGSTRAPRSAFNKTALATTAVAVSVLTGCTTFKPYVLPTLPNSDTTKEALPRSFCNDPRAVTYDLLHTYARHANQHEQIQKWAALGLLPLAGVVAYKSIVAPNLGDIVGLTAAGGVGFAALNFLSTNQQERIYTAGMEALSCALAVIEPTMLPAKLWADRNAARREVAKFNEFLNSFEQVENATATDLKERKGEPAMKLSQVHWKDLKLLVDTVEKGIDKTVQTISMRYPGAESAEGRLCQATLRIAGSVNRQLAEASPDLGTISGKLTAFTSFPTINAPAEPAGMPAMEAAMDADSMMQRMAAGDRQGQPQAQTGGNVPPQVNPIPPVETAAFEMAKKMEQSMTAAVRALAADADMLPAPTPAPPTASIVDTCKVEMVAPPPSLTVVHSGGDEDNVMLKAGQVFEVLVRASGQMPHIDVVPNAPGENFTVSEVMLKDAAFVRTVTVAKKINGAAPKSMSVSVASENNQTVHTIELKIE